MVIDQTGGTVISNSDREPESKPHLPIGGRPPRSNWIAHVALILAVAAVAGILAGRGDRDVVHTVNIGILVAMVLILVVQITIARLSRGAWVSVTGSAISTLGVVCMLLAQIASGGPMFIALTVAGALLFAAAAVTFWFQAVRGRQSR